MRANAPRLEAGRSPFYEVYYVTVNDVANARGVWLRLTSHAPSRGAPACAAWAFVFDGRDPRRNVGLRHTYPPDAFVSRLAPFEVRVGDSALDERGTGGFVDANGRRIAWDLAWAEQPNVREHFPAAWMYRGSFPSTKVVAPAAAVAVSGTVDVDEEVWRFDNAHGQQAHLWGTRHAESWAWGRAGGPDWNWEGLAAIARPRFPRLSLFFLRVGDHSFSWNGYRALTSNKSVHETTSWRFETRRVRGARLVGEVSTRLEDLLAVRYDDPSEGERFCHHTEVADARLTLEMRGEAPRTFTVEKGAAFESGARVADPRVRLAF